MIHSVVSIYDILAQEKQTERGGSVSEQSVINTDPYAYLERSGVLFSLK